MPTITTTVTSACASGVVTTQTTTQATPEAAVVAKKSGNALPKVSSNAVYCLNQFHFKNNTDMTAFADSFLNGVQGYMGGGGCTQHAFEGVDKNVLICFFSLDIEKWHVQNDFWAGCTEVLAGLDSVDWFEASYWGANIPADLDAALQAWAQHPNCRGFTDCTATMATFDQRIVDNDPNKIVLIGFHDAPNEYFEDGLPDFVDFAKQYTWAHSFGDLGNGQYLTLQVFESSADLMRQGDAFTPWLGSGAGPATADWIAKSEITFYSVGGIDDAARAVIKPYGDMPNFTSVFPTLIGGVGGNGRGLSNIMLYFPNKALAVAARAEWVKLFANSKAKGAKLDGSLSTSQGNDTTLNCFCHYATVDDIMTLHQVAYETPSFMANCAKKILHCQVDFFGSMTHALWSTLGGWEALGTCTFSDSLNKQIMTTLYAEEPGDSPIESVQWFETKGDAAPFSNFFTDQAIQTNIKKHRVSFYVADYGGNNIKLYFKFASAASFAEFWTEAAELAGDKLTALVEQGVDINLWLWGEQNAASWVIMEKYGGLPTYAVNGDRDSVTTPFEYDRM